MSLIQDGPFQGFKQNGYDVILADPPWRFATRSDKGRDRCPDAPVSRAAQRRNQPERHYATMSLDEIKALPVADLAAKDALLFMWAIDPMLPHAFEVAAAWGFKYSTVGFYWAKLRKAPMKPGRDEHLDDERKAFPMGTGYWTRANPEQCLLFSRGRPKRVSAGVAKLIAMAEPCPTCGDRGDNYPGSSEQEACPTCGLEPPVGGASHHPLIVSPRREHSRKPDEQYARIGALCGPETAKIELFARQRREGWVVWGNQTDRFGAEGRPRRSKEDML